MPLEQVKTCPMEEQGLIISKKEQDQICPKRQEKEEQGAQKLRCLSDIIS